jgi:hypothetical protein
MYKLDYEWCPPRLDMATFVVTLLVRMIHGRGKFLTTLECLPIAAKYISSVIFLKSYNQIVIVV